VFVFSTNFETVVHKNWQKTEFQFSTWVHGAANGSPPLLHLRK